MNGEKHPPVEDKNAASLVCLELLPLHCCNCIDDRITLYILTEDEVVLAMVATL